jgi:ComF family protein
MSHLVRRITDGFVHLFYPRLCEGCSRALLPAEEVLCLSCSLLLPVTGYHEVDDNDTAMRFAGRFPFVKATSYAWFTPDGLLQHLIHGLKYKGKKANGIFLGRQLGSELTQLGWAQTIDAIVPVPLHPAKEAKRGYNQSRLIAEGMSEALHIPVADNLLHRVRDTESQTSKTRTERLENMARAFELRPSNKKYNHILLCDDVLTTGATLEACALALAMFGDTKISIATIGIAVS